jgi:hypothetical protein
MLQTLPQWLRDPKLVGVRGAALAKLPEAEGAAWRSCWRGVEEALGAAASATKEPPQI